MDQAKATPDEWAGRLSAPADVSSDPVSWPTALIRHWTGTAPEMDQPPLDHHYVVQHLGGAKRVERRRDGSRVCAIVENGALTVVPAGTGFKWVTTGPIEFAHLYISPALLSRTAIRVARSGETSLIDRVGCRDPLLEALYGAMLAQIRQPVAAQTLYLDSLLESFLLRLLLGHARADLHHPRVRETLPAFRVRRVLDFVEANLDKSLSLADLALVGGGSVFHFCRAFKNSAGETPYRYVLRRRSERAKIMLASTNLPFAAVASACGFDDAVQFSRTFARLVGTTPGRFRRSLR